MWMSGIQRTIGFFLKGGHKYTLRVPMLLKGQWWTGVPFSDAWSETDRHESWDIGRPHYFRNQHWTLLAVKDYRVPVSDAWSETDLDSDFWWLPESALDAARSPLSDTTEGLEFRFRIFVRHVSLVRDRFRHESWFEFPEFPGQIWVLT